MSLFYNEKLTDWKVVSCGVFMRSIVSRADAQGRDLRSRLDSRCPDCGLLQVSSLHYRTQ